MKTQMKEWKPVNQSRYFPEDSEGRKQEKCFLSSSSHKFYDPPCWAQAQFAPSQPHHSQPCVTLLLLCAILTCWLLRHISALPSSTAPILDYNIILKTWLSAEQLSVQEHYIPAESFVSILKRHLIIMHCTQSPSPEWLAEAFSEGIKAVLHRAVTPHSSQVWNLPGREPALCLGHSIHSFKPLLFQFLMTLTKRYAVNLAVEN